MKFSTIHIVEPIQVCPLKYLYVLSNQSAYAVVTNSSAFNTDTDESRVCLLTNVSQKQNKHHKSQFCFNMVAYQSS